MTRYLFFLLFILHFTFYIFHSSSAAAIEVGGHISEDTVWSPDNNPYIVTAGIYIDENATLRILPGTIVKFYSDMHNLQNTDAYWFHGNTEPQAKFIQCRGSIIAEGTEQDSIIFTRYEDIPYYHWGTVNFRNEAEIGIFKHCVFEYAYLTGFTLTDQPRGALSVESGSLVVNKCKFIDNDHAMVIYNADNIELKANHFTNREFPHPTLGIHFFLSIGNSSFSLVADNIFELGSVLDASNSLFFVNNEIRNMSSLPNYAQGINYTSGSGIFYVYRDLFTNSRAFRVTGNDIANAYIKNNSFIDSRELHIESAYAEISDNYFERCSVSGASEFELMGKFFSNTIINAGNTALSGRFEMIYNNIINDCNLVTSVIGSSDFFTNNLLISYSSLCNMIADNSIIENNVIIQNNISAVDIYGNPIFRNCILDFELPEECIDGGGNIWVDSLQAQQIFEDIENGDFRLTPGSIAIDAGYDTTGYYYPFDLDYGYRIWDGNGDGNAIIDIGPYEFGAPALPKLCGRVTNIDTGEPVDYVFIRINDEPGNFTFADSAGYFEISLYPDTYDIYAERVFYNSENLQSILVEGDSTFVEITMECTLDPVSVNEELMIQNSSLIISNYPNPFNPVTTINFNLPVDSKVDVSIFNIKGQRVKTLLNEALAAGQHQIVWNGKDESGKLVSSGVFFCKIKTDTKNAVRKILLLK